MSRHRLLHMASLIGDSRWSGRVAPCDCELGAAHPIPHPYRLCPSCGATYATEYVLVEKHLHELRGREPSQLDLYGGFIYECPSCGHDFEESG